MMFVIGKPGGVLLGAQNGRSSTRMSEGMNPMLQTQQRILQCGRVGRGLDEDRHNLWKTKARHGFPQI